MECVLCGSVSTWPRFRQNGVVWHSFNGHLTIRFTEGLFKTVILIRAVLEIS